MEGTEYQLDEENLYETFYYHGKYTEITKVQKLRLFSMPDIKVHDHSAYDNIVCCLLTHCADGGYMIGKKCLLF